MKSGLSYIFKYYLWIVMIINVFVCDLKEDIYILVEIFVIWYLMVFKIVFVVNYIDLFLMEKLYKIKFWLFYFY